MDLFSLSGKTALVSGGNSGLGKAIARALGTAGARVILAGRSLSKLVASYEEFLSDGIETSYLQIDVTDTEAIRRLEDRLPVEIGEIDILVNAAGINVRKPILEISPTDWEMVINTNLRGTFFLSQTVAQHMLKKKSGKIINLASLTSYIGLPNMGPYCASKGGVAQITKAMAVEWAPYIQVNAIAPGYFMTEMTRPIFEDHARLQVILSRIPSGRTGAPTDLLGVAVFLASRASDYITGQIIPVDGGWLAS